MEPLTRAESFDMALAGLVDKYPEPVTRQEKIKAAFIERLKKLEIKNGKKKEEK